MISGLTSAAIDSSNASVSWTTNELANSRVDYGTDSTFATNTQSVSNPAFLTAHTLRLTGLQPNTHYYYALEVDGPEASESASEALARIATDSDCALAWTEDPTLAAIWSDSVFLFVDMLDPRFWLLHTASPAHASLRFLRTLVWKARNIDWPWFPVEAPMLGELSG